MAVWIIGLTWGYSSRAKRRFSASLVDGESIVEILSERTGLPWEQGDGTPVA